jgi:hypothetical protein
MKKVTVSKKAQDELIGRVAKKQNAKIKLDAPRLRHFADLFSEALLESSAETQAAYAAAMIKSV